MRSAFIVGIFALSALLIFVSVAANDPLSSATEDLNEYEDQYLMKLIAQMDDSVNPKSWRYAEQSFRANLNAGEKGFNKERSAYHLANYSVNKDCVRIPKQILQDLKNNEDLKQEYVYVRETMAAEFKRKSKEILKTIAPITKKLSSTLSLKKGDNKNKEKEEDKGEKDKKN